MVAHTEFELICGKLWGAGIRDLNVKGRLAPRRPSDQRIRNGLKPTSAGGGASCASRRERERGWPAHQAGRRRFVKRGDTGREGKRRKRWKCFGNECEHGDGGFKVEGGVCWLYSPKELVGGVWNIYLAQPRQGLPYPFVPLEWSVVELEPGASDSHVPVRDTTGPEFRSNVDSRLSLMVCGAT